VAPPPQIDADERADALPQQEEFWKPPTRFGSVPVEKEPLGWDRRRVVLLPTNAGEEAENLIPEASPFGSASASPTGYAPAEPNTTLLNTTLQGVGQIKRPKWARTTCQTHFGSGTDAKKIASGCKWGYNGKPGKQNGNSGLYVTIQIQGPPENEPHGIRRVRINLHAPGRDVNSRPLGVA
jgi:hypothetical protein